MTTYYGETQCQALVKSTKHQCSNNAYFVLDGKYVCGIHGKSKKATPLPKNPNKKANIDAQLSKHKHTIEHAFEQNRKNKVHGKITVRKMRMMKKVYPIDGYLSVFPNYKHQNRKDGYGCASISPKSLGPVNHGMPNLPPAQNIENYHQYAKFWDFELDDHGEVIPKYFDERVAAYKDKTPYRHKYDKKTLLKYNKNINIPKCSIYYDGNSMPHKYNYVECRYFYCKFYEDLVVKKKDFITLKTMLKNGYNLCIFGFDGYEPIEDYMSMYLDTSKPFGHEIILYIMLTEDDPQMYPWTIYYKKNKKIYDGVI